jgi:hypothetical protein
MEGLIVDRRDPEQLRDWAYEHLAYEVNTITYATHQIALKPTGSKANVLIESFAVHARGLHDFFWRDRTKDSFETDAFAADFCSPSGWEKARGEVPPHLAETMARKRFGAEVMHLTYKRISGITERKLWPCGEIYGELAGALARFAHAALPDRLHDSTRASFKDLVVVGPRGLRAIPVATGLVPTNRISGGTINLDDIRI